MGKQYLELPSYQKTRANNRILGGLLSNIQYQKDNLGKYIETHGDKSNHGYKRSLMIAAVPQEKWDEFIPLIDMYEQTQEDFAIVYWFVNRVLSTSIDISAAREAIPECYWKHLHGIQFNGDNTIKELWNPKCYAILEQIQINNLLLGIRDN
jgi:hypothetical protein